MVPLNLRDWQKKALAAWKANGSMGIISASTGSGKSFLAMAAMQGYPAGVYVLVTTAHLMRQWHARIKEHLGVDAGMLGDGEDSRGLVTVCIVNSVRGSSISASLLVVDEVHRFSEAEQSRAVVDSAHYEAIMGISATPGTAVSALRLPLVYYYGLDEAIRDGEVADYTLTTLTAKLTAAERMLERQQTETINRLLPKYNYDIGIAKMHLRSDKEAAQLFRAITKRRQLLLGSYDKLRVASHVLFERKKTVVFCEYIKTAEEFASLIKSLDFSPLIYHSKLSKGERATMLSLFASSPDAVMIAVKALDEGMDLPDVDRALIISGTSLKRQMLQRIGRCLRKDGDKVAEIVQVVTESQDAKWAERRTRGLHR